MAEDDYLIGVKIIKNNKTLSTEFISVSLQETPVDVLVRANKDLEVFKDKSTFYIGKEDKYVKDSMHVIPPQCKLSRVMRCVETIYHILVIIQDDSCPAPGTSVEKNAFAILKNAQVESVLPKLNPANTKGPNLLNNWIVTSFLSPTTARFKPSDQQTMDEFMTTVNGLLWYDFSFSNL